MRWVAAGAPPCVDHRGFDHGRCGGDTACCHALRPGTLYNFHICTCRQHTLYHSQPVHVAFHPFPVDLQPLEAHRAALCNASAVAPPCWQPLGAPVLMWRLDCRHPPKAESAVAVLQCTAAGVCNAVAWWHSLNMDGTDDSHGCAVAQPRLHMLGRGVTVVDGQELMLQAGHNGVDMVLSVQDCPMPCLEPCMPLAAVEAAYDTKLLEAYDTVLRRMPTATSHTSHVVTLGNPALHVLAARHAAAVTTAAALRPLHCAMQRVAAVNGRSTAVTVALAQPSSLRRGVHGIPSSGADALVVDAGPWLRDPLKLCRLLCTLARRVLAPGVVVVPAAASIMAVGVQLDVPCDEDGKFCGIDLSPMHAFWYGVTYTCHSMTMRPSVLGTLMS